MYDKIQEKKVEVKGVCFKTDGVNYVKIATQNNALLAKLIDLARGDMSAEKFCNICNISPATYFRTLNGIRKLPMQFYHLQAIADHAVPGSHVTLERLAAANGMSVDKKLIQELVMEMEKKRRKIVSLPKPEKNGGQSSYFKQPRPVHKPGSVEIPFPASAEPKVNVNSYDDFVIALSLYLNRKSEDTIRKVHSKRQKIFDDKKIVKTLLLFRYYKEYEENKKYEISLDFLENGSVYAKPDSISDTLREQLDDTFALLVS